MYGLQTVMGQERFEFEIVSHRRTRNTIGYRWKDNLSRYPNARRIRHGRAGGGLLDADRQVVQPVRTRCDDHETPPAEQGIPETILYSNGAEARKIYTIGYLCEPQPDADSVAMANALIRASPCAVNVADPVEREKVLHPACRLSRALLGNRLADQFQFPKARTAGTLLGYRTRQRVLRWPKDSRLVNGENFAQLLKISAYHKEGLSYRVPDHVKHRLSTPW